MKIRFEDDALTGECSRSTRPGLHRLLRECKRRLGGDRAAPVRQRRGSDDFGASSSICGANSPPLGSRSKTDEAPTTDASLNLTVAVLAAEEDNGMVGASGLLPGAGAA